MQNPNVYVKLYEGMGRGLAAFTMIEKGKFVMECELLVLSQFDTPIANMTELKHYTFKYNESQDCLVLGNGEIFNHSDEPNVKYELVDYTQDGETRKVMMFTAIRHIDAGEQLFIDYNADIPVDTKEYVNSKSLVG
jgi:SET domain-containing protein